MPTAPDADSPSGQRLSARWVLRGEAGAEGARDDVPLARCLDVEGLFADLPPRPRERFTLVACAPAGALADLPAERVWLGNIAVTESSWPVAELGDVVVLAHRPSMSRPGMVDIDLDGFVRVDDRTDAVPRPRDVAEFVLLDGNREFCGTCADVLGVFREQTAPPVAQVRVLGCQPEPALVPALDAVGRAGKAGLRRREVRAWFDALATDGSVVTVIGAVLSGTIAAVEPSRHGAGLVDLTIERSSGEPLPKGLLDVLAQWRAGRPSQPNLWAGHDREMRHHWAGLALGNRTATPDRPPGTTYHLDGRFVTDAEGSHCAIGEAVNGPGGYFGWNLDALDDCLCGRFGAQAPFRLVWHDSAVARDHLVAGYDRLRLQPALTLDDIEAVLTEHGVEIDHR